MSAPLAPRPQAPADVRNGGSGRFADEVGRMRGALPQHVEAIAHAWRGWLWISRRCWRMPATAVAWLRDWLCAMATCWACSISLRIPMNGAKAMPARWWNICWPQARPTARQPPICRWSRTMPPRAATPLRFQRLLRVLVPPARRAGGLPEPGSGYKNRRKEGFNYGRKKPRVWVADWMPCWAPTRPPSKYRQGAGQARGPPSTLPVSKMRAGKYQPRAWTRAPWANWPNRSAHKASCNPFLCANWAKPGQYEIIAGERRFRAQLAGLKEVPVLVREVADEHAAVMALIENIQREDLNPLEAHGVRRLLDEVRPDARTAAQAIGRSRSATSNLLRLLNLAAPVQTMLLAGDVDMGHARALLAVDAARIQLANQIIARRLSVREAEAGRQDRQGAESASAPRKGQWRVARSDAPGGSLVRSSGHARRSRSAPRTRARS